MTSPTRSRPFPSCWQPGTERRGGDHRRHGLPEVDRREGRRKASWLRSGGEGNQGHLLEEVKDSFRMLEAESVAEEIDCGHGRVERRTYSLNATKGITSDKIVRS